jgi:hypothetical protein
MTTRVPIRYGGTGANTAAGARITLGAAPSIAYDQANTAYGQANLAYAQANAAFTAANNGNLLLGGVITGTLNVTQDIIVGGNVYLEGNTTFINVATYAVEDSLIYLASNNQLTDSVDIGFMGGKNTGGTYAHTGLVRDATDAKWKLFDGLPEEGHVGNVVNFNNTYLATLVANVEANTLSVINGVSGNVDFDSGTLFVDSINNRIGIGTTNPGSRLDVNGGIRATTFASNTFGVGANPLTGVSTAAQSLRFLTTGADFYFGVESSTAGSFFPGSTAYAGVLYSAVSTPIQFYTAGAVRATLDPSGNLGIGTTNPSQKLDVVGNIKTSGTMGANGTIDLAGDGGAGYVASRLILRTHDNYRGTGIFMVGETSAVSNNTFFIGTPYTGHSAGIYIRYTANNYQTDYQSSAYTGAGTTLMHLAPGGAVTIPGSLSKGSGSFKIDHPLPEKANSHFLVHSFIEGPQADLIYSGRVQLQNGSATINIDTHSNMTEGTFIVLCRDIRCFTTNETSWDAVRGSVSGNILTIECQNPTSNATVSWMVIGERQDKHMLETEWTDESGKVIVEPEKPATEILLPPEEQPELQN